MQKFKDIIEIPEVKLVIELDDADNDPDGILSSFVLTEEVENSLEIILKKISKKEGCGIFLKGNFGSGKSHFLSYLYLVLKGKAKTEAKAKAKDWCPEISEMDLEAVKISLVKYPASQTLEKIVLSSLGYEEEVINRDNVFKEIINRPSVLIIDELSEFLRSKPNSSFFHEDIRFLQFLGEHSSKNPLWIVASLQEWIEETGHIASNIFNRIKDRYPLRINLSSSHIEDIIDKRIIIKKDNSLDIIKEVFSDLKKYYPDLKLRYDEFLKTYPLHPFTVRYLSGLTPVFSQHRGVIQFVFSEVRKILDEICDLLITPDIIFNHFEERIREIPEYSPLVRRVYDYYKTNIEKILPEQSQMETALSVISILILTEISPLEKRKTAREIAEMLLKRISTLTSHINYDFIKDGILEPLVSHKMYINRENDSYFIDPKVDEGIKIKAKIKALRERYEDRNLLFLEICNLSSMSYLPLKDIKEGRRYKIIWQNSMRECIAIISFPSQLNMAEIERILERVKKRFDGYLILMSPFSDEREWINSLGNTFRSEFLKLIIFWIPRKFTHEEGFFIEEYIAKYHLTDDFPELKAEAKQREVEFREIITKAYFEGGICYGSGKGVSNIKEIGYLPIEKLISHLLDPVLSEVHPDHFRVMPRVEYFSSRHLSNLYNIYIKQGKITIEESEKKGLSPYIKGLLEPIGIVKKRGGSYIISLDAENDLISYTLNLISQEPSLSRIKLAIKKGRWGMGEGQTELLLSAFISSGHIVPYRNEEIIDFKDIVQLSTGEITSLKTGKTLSPELLGYIRHGNFIWGEVEDVPTPLTQKRMWKETTSLKRETRQLINSINDQLEKYRDYKVLKKAFIDRSILNRLAMFFDSLLTSLSPSEGLQKVLSHLRENNDLKGELEYLGKIYAFLLNDFQSINKYYDYLTHGSLRLPDELEEMRRALNIIIEDYLNSFNLDFDSIKDKWEEFFDMFTEMYKEGHEQYYSSPVFKIRKEVEANQHGKILRRISMILDSVSFDFDWLMIKRDMNDLPDICKADMVYELFKNPICKCGYRIGDEPPLINRDFAGICREGLLNFFSFLLGPDNKDKLDAYIQNLRDAGKDDMADRLASILNINISKKNLSLVYPLLTDDILEELNNAFRGRWKVRKLMLYDFTQRIRGMRLRYKDLKDMFLKWIGDDDESIIWIRDMENTNYGLVREELSKYGIQGDRASTEISGAIPEYEGFGIKEEGVKEIEYRMKEEERLDIFDSIRLSSYSTDELLTFLKIEQFDYLRKKLREEIYLRLSGKRIDDKIIKSIDDEFMGGLLRTDILFEESHKYTGIDKFINTAVPLTLLINKIMYENQNGDKIDKEIINRIKDKADRLLNEYENNPDKVKDAKDIQYIKDRIEGVVVILNGLRYDLWSMLKGLLLEKGCTVKESQFIIQSPSSTSNFRKVIGIEVEGKIEGKSYKVWKFAEKDAGKRELKKFLKTEYDIKFLYYNFIDVKVHSSSLDMYPLFLTIQDEFRHGILPILKEIPFFYIVADHGFVDTKKLKDRYTHGGSSPWETVLPFAEVNYGVF